MNTGEFDVFVIRNSEVLPSDGSGSRLWRSGLFAEYLGSRGLNVHWIVSSFDHYNKVQRNGVSKYHPKNGVKLSILKTPSYSSNLSPKRLLEHGVFSIKLLHLLLKLKKPKIIFCSWPTPESSFVCVLFGLIFSVPVVIDVRDKWPSVFFESIDVKFKFLYKVAFVPYFIMRFFCMRYAAILTAVTPEYLEWAQKCGRRNNKLKDKVLNIPFVRPELEALYVSEADVIFDKFSANQNELVITFAGTLGKMFDFTFVDFLIEHSRSAHRKILLIVCGDGDSFTELKSRYSKYPEVAFTGRLHSTTVYALLLRSDCLLACYRDLDNFRDHLPNKFMEYLSAGRPIVSSLTGYASDILNDSKAGCTYRNEVELWGILERYMSDPLLLEEQASAAKRLFDDRFKPELVFSEMDSIFL